MADDWTPNQLKELMEVRFSSLERAVDKAETAFENRLSGLNEFRGTVEILIKEKVNQESHDALAARMKRLEDAETKSGGKVAGYSQIGTILGVSVATASAAVVIFAAITG